MFLSDNARSRLAKFETALSCSITDGNIWYAIIEKLAGMYISGSVTIPAVSLYTPIHAHLAS